MKKLLSILAGIVLSSQALAQDFYNGCKGPSEVQIDNYVNYSDDNVSGMVIPKVFTKNLLFAVPFGISKKVENKGVNLGYCLENLYGNNVIGALGLFKDDEGKYKVVNPQLYLTRMHGPVTLDLEGALPTHLEGNSNWSLSTTLGYGINDWLRVGGSISKEKDKEVEGRGNVRVELKKDHQYWFQVYAGKNLGMRFVGNF